MHEGGTLWLPMEAYVYHHHSCSRRPGTSALRVLLMRLLIMMAHAERCRPRRCIYIINISTEALVAYSAPRGGDMQAMTGGAKFEDLAYDGVMRDGKLFDGLGQMTDSLLGPNDFELPDPLDTRGKKSYFCP